MVLFHPIPDGGRACFCHAEDEVRGYATTHACSPAVVPGWDTAGRHGTRCAGRGNRRLAVIADRNAPGCCRSSRTGSPWRRTHASSLPSAAHLPPTRFLIASI